MIAYFIRFIFVSLWFGMIAFGCSAFTDTRSEPIQEKASFLEPAGEPISDSKSQVEPAGNPEPAPEPPPSAADSSEPSVELSSEPSAETFPDTFVREGRPVREQAVENSPEPPESGSKSWVVALGAGADQIQGTKIAYDSKTRGVYLAGRVQGKARIGNAILQTKGVDSFLARLDSQGQVQWVLPFGGDGIQDIRDIQTSPTGDITLTGTFSRVLVVNQQTYYVSKGGCFVAQIKPTGALKWLVQAGGQGADVGDAIVHDASGNAYILGSFNGPGQFGSLQLTHKHLYDLFVTRINPQGQFEWVTATRGSATSSGASIAIDNKGNLTILAQFIADIRLGSLKLNSDYSDLLVAQLSSQGNFRWAVSTRGSGQATPHHIRSDLQGNLTIVGEVEGEKSFGSKTLKQPRHGDIFLARLSPQGVFQWVKQISGANVHIHPNGMALQGQNLFIAGEYTGQPKFGKHSLPSSQEFQPFLVGADNQGTFQWAISAPNRQSVYGRALAVSPQQELFLIGEFENSARFGTLNIQPGRSQTYLYVWKHYR